MGTRVDDVPGHSHHSLRWQDIMRVGKVEEHELSTSKNAPTILAKQLSKRDREQRCLLTAAFESAGEGIVTTDKRGHITQINKTALATLGYRPGDVRLKHFQQVFVATDQNGIELDIMHRPQAMCMQQQKPISARLHYRTKSGSIIPVAVNVAPVINRGRVEGTIQVFHDISDELEFDQLQSEFISLASHQLRTPLTAISTYGHMLLSGFKGPLNEGQIEFMKTILTSADRMSNLINTLLNVSRLGSGDISTTIGEVNVTQVISKTKQELWPLAKTKGQYLITKAPEKDIIIQTDELLLTEICANLISNAIKYTPESGKVTIELVKTDEEIRIIVTDNGYGIPAHLQQRVFSKFFRAPNILHAEAVGTGLGLFLVREITHRLGGTISFSSKEGKGSAFTVTLPCASGESPEKSLATNPHTVV